MREHSKHCVPTTLIASIALAGASRAAPPQHDHRHLEADSTQIVDMLSAWGDGAADANSDRNGDGVVDASDLMLLLAPGQRAGLIRTCPVEPSPGQLIIHPQGIAGGGIAGGGMAGDGWDGAGQGSATVFWHVEAATPDFGAGQRTALINAMQTWANVVQITFQELPVPNTSQSVDWNFLAGDHCAAEPDECGDPDCPFGGPGGVLAHAGFPVGVNSACVNPMAETWAGNVHFDEAETWEQDDSAPSNDNMFSMTLIAAHEVGHSIGLTHDLGPGGPHIMRPSFSDDAAAQLPSASDIANLQAGYAAGSGAVVTLEDTGVWVDSNAFIIELGTQAFPFDTVIEGVNGVPPFSTQVTLHIDAGAYNQNLTITQAMIIEAENGAVVIE